MSPRSKQTPRALLLLLPLLLPFEAPLFSVGPIVITTAELALYLVIAAWTVTLVGRGALRGGLGLGAADELGRAVLVWLAIEAVSALLAPAHRAASMKFVLRSGSGVLLFFAARDLTRSADDARRIGASLVAGAALAAALAVLEGVLPHDAGLWRMFRPGAFTSLGLPRASGAFAYPTIGAMYWEAALPLCLVVPLAGAAAARAHPRLRVGLGLALAALLIGALLRSATRTALVGAAAATLALLALGWKQGPRLRIAAGGALALIALLVTGSFVASGPADARMAQRLRWWQDGTWFSARYFPADPHLRLTASTLADVDITIENSGSLAWPHVGRDAVFVSYHWQALDRAHRRFEFEGRRTPLPADVPPGGRVRVAASVRAPREPGPYLLRWDLVRETVTWFSERGGTTGDQPVDVVADRSEDGDVAPPLQAAELGDFLTPLSPSRSELWRAALRLWARHPMLGVGPDNFRRLYPATLEPARGGRRFEDDRLHANNFYLETLADLGLLGLAALALIMFTLARAVRARVRDDRDGDAALLRLGWTLAAATFFVHGLLDYFLEFTPTLGLYWLSLALAGGAWRTGGASPAPAGSTP